MNDSQRLSSNQNLLNTTSNHIAVSRPSLGRNGKKNRRTNSFILNNNSFIKEIEQSENEESPDFRRKEGLRR